MKKEVLVGTIIVTFVVLTNAQRIEDDNDGDLDSFGESLIRRYLLHKYLSMEDRETPMFTEDQQRFQNETLVVHNLLRAHHCVPPLVLDDEINLRAQAYAELLAANDTGLVHSTDRGGRFGENLYSLTRKTPIPYADADKATRAWYSEFVNYNYSDPRYSKNTGHFSQIVWKNSQRIGVGYAYARERRKLYVAAQYAPPGNYGFAYARNVFEPTC